MDEQVQSFLTMKDMYPQQKTVPFTGHIIPLQAWQDPLQLGLRDPLH